MTFFKFSPSSGPITPAIPKRNIGVIYHNSIPLSTAAKTFLEYFL